MAERKPCGTYAAYRRHLRANEAVDEACAAAAREQKNVRKQGPAMVSVLESAPVVDSVDELSEALENLRIVKAAMEVAPANAVAPLSKRREELVARIAKLQNADKPEVSALDQLAQRRAERLAAASG